ncbi:ATP-binding protein [Algoriphagus limi]|uniref:histidine kinase n=1 Tax=Algoriphagus limi TaxID=2975273 RepID=A0ABT2G7P9_9BACT|nr:ATP-binding protein [Algoriphagus limi]MCS5491311.1 ATP-binding protein [Algoriphagus limi]
MKKTVLLALLLVLSLYGMSQDNEADFNNNYLEYHRGLKESVSDSSRAFYLSNLANYYKFSRPDSGIYYATKGFELAKKIGNKRMELRALGSLALSHETLGNSITAYRIALDGLREVEEYDPERKGEYYRMLGSITRQNQKFVEAREYFLKAKDEFFRTNKPGALATIYAELGVVNSEIGDIDSAFYYGYQGIALAESIQAPVPMDVAYDRMGNIHNRFQNLDSALFYYKLSYAVRSEVRKSPSILRKIASIYTQKEQPDSALYYAEESLIRGLTNGLYEDVSESSLFFSDFYENRDPSKAITYYKMALNYQDSLEYMSKMTGFADLANFDELQRQAELERANEAYQSRLRTTILIGSTFTLLIIAFFLYRNNRAKHKSKLQIEGAYNQLKSTQAQLIQSEKMASLGELTAGIAHEIQNPLNFVNNFSELNKELIADLIEEIENGDLEEVKLIATDIENNEEKINHHGKRAGAIVKSMLEHSRTNSGERTLTDLNELADEYLRLSYHGLRAKDKSFQADFKTDFEPNLPKVNIVAQDIGRVLLNLINNAFYVVDEKAKSGIEGYKPEVIVNTNKTERGIEISVKDNGKGIPESIKEKIFQPFFTTKPTGSGTGLGLSLSYDIVKAHGGEIKIESKEGRGTVFTLEIPFPTN